MTPHPDYLVRLLDQELVEELAASPNLSGRSDQQWLKNECLKRDDFRCILTGRVDRDQQRKHPGEKIVHTNCAHVIPASLGCSAGRENISAMIWTAITRYFPGIKDTRMTPLDVNVPENALTLASFLHTSFGRFDFSLDAVVSLSRKLLCIYINAS